MQAAFSMKLTLVVLLVCCVVPNEASLMSDIG
jgi:hypothetical protein